MHDLLVQVQVRVVTVHRQRRRQFHHTHQHQRRHFTGGAGHGEDHAGHHRRAGHRQHDLPQGFSLGRAEGQRAFTHGARNPRQAFFGGHDHHRHRQQRQGQRSPEQTRRTEGRCRQCFREEQTVERAAQHIDEEAQAEHAVNDRRNTRQVVHRDADDSGQRVLLGVFTQVNRCQHAERSHDHRHDQGHHHGAENRRENPAFGVCFTRVVGQELPDLAEIETDLGEGAHGVRLVGVNHFAQTDFDFFAIGVAGCQSVAVELCMQVSQTCFDILIAGVQLSALGFHVRLCGCVEFAFQLQLAAVQTDALQTCVDRTNITLFQ
ncbi:hypothetical protein D3C86_1287150 [compost metagenome]